MAAPYLRSRHSLTSAFRSRVSPRAPSLSHPSRLGGRRAASTSSSTTTQSSVVPPGLKLFLYGTSISASLYLLYYYATDTRASFHRWAIPPLIRLLYPDAEDAHHAGTEALKNLYNLNLHPRERPSSSSDETSGNNPLAVTVFGTELRNPIGISAGLDKNADIPDPLFALGAGVVEVGGCTPFPQEGNPKPRVFRVPSLDGMINRYGLNSRGADAMAARLRDRLRKLALGLGLSEQDVMEGNTDGIPPGSLQPGKLLLVQVAKNKTTNERDVDAVIKDYTYCVNRLAPYADVLVVNVSSPNTPGLRDLQATEPLTRLLSAVVDEAQRTKRKQKPKVMVKVSPDEDDDAQMEGVVQAVWESGVDGVVVGNTTKRRNVVPQGVELSNKEARALTEEGGYSGPALFDQTLALVGRYRKMLDAYSLQTGARGAAQKVLFATGGITNGEQALKVLNAGASVAMVYTGMVYGGSGTVTRIKGEMRQQIAAGSASDKKKDV